MFNFQVLDSINSVTQFHKLSIATTDRGFELSDSAKNCFTVQNNFIRQNDIEMRALLFLFQKKL